MSLSHNITMVYIDMQGEEHHCQEEQEFGNSCQDKNNQPIEMSVLETRERFIDCIVQLR
jgi:hypothetical protein